MSKIIGLEELSHSLRTQLTNVLRIGDEAVTLPNATRSVESGAFKNTVLKLNGSEPNLDPELFGSDPKLFSGVSLIEVPERVGNRITTQTAEERARMLAALRAAIPSEMADSELQVGPTLDADECDRDLKPWKAGFDSATASVGLYSARQRRKPADGAEGMARTFKSYYLVARAGGGAAAQLFPARLPAALRAGKTLDEALESETRLKGKDDEVADGTGPGAQALRRVATAGRRNRARILALAARAMGFDVDCISDTASHPGDDARGAIVSADVIINSLRKDAAFVGANDVLGKVGEAGGVAGEGSAAVAALARSVGKSTWIYSAGSVDAVLSTGLVTSSNAAAGYVLFLTPENSLKTKFRNTATSHCIPFATPRTAKSRDLVIKAAAAHKAVAARGGAHPDAAYIRRTFTWKSKSISGAVDIEPACLWGSHMPESFISSWSRELCLTSYSAVRLEPEAVCLAALEPAKLRAGVRHVLS